MYFSNKSAGNVSILLTGFTERTEERANHGSNVDWYSCADRGSDWWPVHVIQLVRCAVAIKVLPKPTLIQISIPRYSA